MIVRIIPSCLSVYQQSVDSNYHSKHIPLNKYRSKIRSSIKRPQILPSAFGNAAGLRVFVLSDLHTDYTENMNWVKSISTLRHKKDVLLVAGDVAEMYNNFVFTMSLLKDRFEHVFYVPGNHDLWCRRGGEDYVDSVEKLNKLLDACIGLGVETNPTVIDGLGIIPLFSWYHESFDREKDITGIRIPSLEMVIHFLSSSGVLGSKPIDTPINPNIKLLVDQVSMASQFLDASQTSHWDAITHILRYLKGAPGRGLLYKDHRHIQIEGYTDVDRVGSLHLIGGTVDSLKSRLVARGCTQIYGLDNSETFSRVANIASVYKRLPLSGKDLLKGCTQIYGLDYFDSFSPVACKDFHACKWPWEISNGDTSLALYFDAMNEKNMNVIKEIQRTCAQIVTFSHFVPRQELCPEKRMLFYPKLPKIIGSNYLEVRLRSIHGINGNASACHVFGHTHFCWDAVLDGIRYVQAPLAYPRERKRRMNGGENWLPFCIYSDGNFGDKLSPCYWSDYYSANPRTPHNTELAPWVARFYNKT